MYTGGIDHRKNIEGLIRSDQEPVIVNLDIEPIEAPQEVKWTDSLPPNSERSSIPGKTVRLLPPNFWRLAMRATSMTW